MTLIELFSARPVEPPKCARLVRGYAMSGSKDSQTIAVATEKNPKRAHKKPEPKRKAQREDTERRYRSAMFERGWMATRAVADFAGTSDGAAFDVLTRLVLENKVESRRVPKTGTPGYKREWRWLTGGANQ